MKIVKSERGQSLLEVAIFAPFMILLMLGIIDIARYSFAAATLANSARTGAEYGSQNFATALDYTGMQAAATDDASYIPGLAVTASSMCVCSDGSSSQCLPTDCSSSHRLTYVTVTSSATIKTIITYPGITPSIAMQRIVKMEVSQ
jgi:Flp pilus assembly protein TadG